MSWRTELVELLPWVRRYARRRQCDAYRPMSRRARLDPVRRETYRCVAPAWWRYVALDDDWAQTGTYCWSHLLSRGLYGDEAERRRHVRWWNRHLIEVNEVRARHGLDHWIEGEKNDHYG